MTSVACFWGWQSPEIGRREPGRVSVGRPGGQREAWRPP